VLTRVHGLSGQAHELLVTAAVVGSRFSPDLLAAVHGLSQDVMLQAVTEAAAHSLVHSRGPDEFAFLHDRIRGGPPG
jgi:predicted ATPase